MRPPRGGVGRRARFDIGGLRCPNRWAGAPRQRRGCLGADIAAGANRRPARSDPVGDRPGLSPAFAVDRRSEPPVAALSHRRRQRADHSGRRRTCRRFAAGFCRGATPGGSRGDPSCGRGIGARRDGKAAADHRRSAAHPRQATASGGFLGAVRGRDIGPARRGACSGSRDPGDGGAPARRVGGADPTATRFRPAAARRQRRLPVAGPRPRPRRLWVGCERHA